MNAANLEISDINLWEAANRDDETAFETLVRRHQSAVCAVAYNACGNLSLSEDIAQEAFWTAWRNRGSLLDPSRLRAWLCGIARNLARNSRRNSSSAPASLEHLPEPAIADEEPFEQAVTREEENLVWETLEQIPETYREPLILFYRESQSVAEVAATLDISVDAVKQRLSRGRSLLREQVADLVEGTLRRSAPRGKFTVSVMAGLTTATVFNSSAMAAGGGSTVAATTIAAKAIPAASSAAMSSAIGGLAGAAGGFLGGWLGTWVPAQLAPTNRERQRYLAVGRRLLIISVIATLALAAVLLPFIRTMTAGILITVIVSWIVIFQAYIAIEAALLTRAVRKIRQETPPESDPNTSWVKAYAEQKIISQWEGRTYRSSTTLFGLPLVDIQISDPSISNEPRLPRKARGWIAIGDNADGILLAIGGVARGAIALGGLAIGLISCGGCAIGVIAVGGGALGAIALGGMAAGGISLGGMAIGWQAAGGAVLAWDTAIGGCAVAHHAAKGGAALAHDYAVGGAASAVHANDDAAKAVLNSHWLSKLMDQFQNPEVQWALLVICIGLPIASQLLAYKRRRPPTEVENVT